MITSKSSAGYKKRVWSPEEDEILMDKVSSQGPSNWNEISSFVPERTAKQCRERWHNHLMGGFKKGDWSEEEDRIIKLSHSMFGNQWSSISKNLPGRSVTDIKNRFNSLGKVDKRAGSSETMFETYSSVDSYEFPTENENIKLSSEQQNNLKRVWTPEEDAVLMNKINTLGLVNWNVIASDLPGRTGKQCRERYHNHLREGIRKGDWTKEEDDIILSTHSQFGNKWTVIANRLTSRSSNDVKNRFKSIAKNIDYKNNFVMTDEEMLRSSQSSPTNHYGIKRVKSDCSSSVQSTSMSVQSLAFDPQPDRTTTTKFVKADEELVEKDVEEGISCFKNFLNSLYTTDS